MRKVTIIAVVLLLVAAIGATAVLARESQAVTASPALQDPVVPEQQDESGTTTAPVAPAWGQGMMRGQRGAYGMGAGIGAGHMWDQGAPLETIASALGMTVEDVTAALQSGSTIAGLAEQQGVSVESIVSDLLAAHQAQLDAAVAAGTITADEAALMQEQMAEMWTLRIQEGSFFGGRGFAGQGNPDCPFGSGEGPAGFGGRGMHGRGGFGYGQRGLPGQGTAAPANGING